MLRHSSRLTACLALGLMGGVVLLADGAQTGTLVGVVKDDKGMPIPAAAIRITGSTLMGERLLTTSATGSFRAPSLPPGSAYEVTVVAEGYQTAKVPARVGVNQVFQMTVALQPIAASVVEVIAMGSSIDTTTVSSPTNMSREMIDNLPIPGGRDYQSVMALTPGIVGGNNPAALGGSYQENLYLLDGVDTTDATVGQFSMNLNEEAVEEIQVLTTGLSAEYGRFGGAIANVVTKSGGNTFEGGVRYDFYNLAWNAQGKWPEKPESKLVGIPYLSLGGPLVKDTLWFFVTAQRTKDEAYRNVDNGDSFTRTFKSDPVAYSAKLSWQINPNHSLVLQATGDPTMIQNENIFKAVDLGAVANQKQGVKFMSLTYRAVPRQDLTFDVKVAQHNHIIDITSNAGDVVPWDWTENWYERNIPNELRAKRTRNQFNAAMVWYHSVHEIKTGFDLQSSTSASRLWYPGGKILQVYWDNGVQPDTLTVQETIRESESKQNYIAFYLNDVWRMGSGLVANLGLRFEQYIGKNDIGTKVWDYSSISPRLGLTYDWKDNGRQSVGVSYSRYATAPQQFALDQMAVIRNQYTNYSDWNGAVDWYDPNSYNSGPQPEPWGKAINASDNLKAGYADEWVVSGKFQIADRWVLNTQGVMRNFYRPIVLFSYYDVKPGSTSEYELMRELRSASDAKRKYRAFINTLSYEGESWNAHFSYTYSSLRGNYEPGMLNDSYGAFYEGKYIPKYNDARAWGRLDMDQPHKLQVLATHRFDLGHWGFVQGITATYQSGSVWANMAEYKLEEVGLNVADPNNQALLDQVIRDKSNKHFITQNGEWGDRSFSSRFRLNYSLYTTYQIAGSLRLRLGVDVLNILNHFKPESYINRNTAKIENGKPVITPVNNYGVVLPEQYTPGRAIRFTTSLRF